MPLRLDGKETGAFVGLAENLMGLTDPGFDPSCPDII
jgi:hypothetical protein